MPEYSLYFHVPFCSRKCPYCHFYVTKNHLREHASLLAAFENEWQQKKALAAGKKLVSIYFGGGTPSLLGPKAISEILSYLDYDEECEITLEANPEEITFDLMKAFFLSGINRVSIGVQSLDDEILKVLGRTHTAEKAIRAIQDTAKAGISNISIDLMYEIPSLSLKSWASTLKQACALPITHLSLYNLTFEPKTTYFRKQKELLPLVPEPATNLEMLKLAVDLLEKADLKRYEISAFAKNGFQSRHNTGYWIGRPFLGLGPSAFSYWDGKRFRNVANLKSYCHLVELKQNPADFEEKLPFPANVHERLAIALRRLEGVEMTQFPVNAELYETLIERGWMQVEGRQARLTEQGLLFYDSVAEEIVYL